MMVGNSEELERLRRQLEEVTAERDGLLAENRRLRRDYSISPQKPGKVILPPTSVNPGSLSVIRKPATDSVVVNNEAPSSEKVRLFRSLFRGREDVFARQWWSQKSQRIGYSPVCNREWNPAWCVKPGMKCGVCPNQDFAPVTDKVIQDHLEGRHTIRIYPLLSDDPCPCGSGKKYKHCCGRLFMTGDGGKNMRPYKFHGKPEILATEEYINIVGDYRDPKEAMREAISNSLDWGANTISIEVLLDLRRPREELIIKIQDNGLGLNKSRLKAFFDLGNSTALETDELGHKISSRIGEKGHGTKTFFNCREIETFSQSDECTITALMKEPLLTLHNEHHVPEYDYHTRWGKLEQCPAKSPGCGR